MADKEVKIKVTTETDVSSLNDLKSVLEEVKSSADELGTSVSNNLNEVGDGADNAESSVEGLDSSVDTLNNNLDSVNGASLDETASSADELGSATENAGNSANTLNDSLGTVTGGGLDSASSSADGLGYSLDNAKNSSDNLNDSLNVIESASFMGLAEGIGQYAAGAENLAQEMNTASISVGQLATQTGIAEPQMVSLINHISNATFPNEEAMMYVKSLDQIGVSSQNLGKSATDLDKINDAFGLGATKVNSLGQELSVLGVDMNNVSSSFNALAYANANTVGGMENYYSFLKKYDAQFKELGYNVDQASIIIAGATQKFGGGRAALSGLSNALKEANGDSRKLEEALGLQAGALDNASQITGQYEGQLQKLADEEAEHKTWIDQINAAWEDMSLALSPILSPLASFVGLIGQVGQSALAINSIVTLANSIRGLSIVSSITGKFNTLIGGLRTVAGVAKTAALELATLGKKVLLAGANALKTVAMWAAETAAKVASTVATTALAIAEWLLASPILLVVVALVALIAVLWYLYNTNETVRAAIDSFVQTLINGWNYIVTTVQSAVQQVIMFFTNLYLNIVATGQWIWNSILSVLSFIATVPGRVWNYLLQIINRVIQFGSNVVNNLRNSATNAVNGFINGIASLPGRVYNELSKTLSRVMEWGSQIVSRLGEIAQRAWQAFINGLGIGSPGYIQILTLKELEDTGKRIPGATQGIIDNLGKMAGEAVDAWGTPSFQYGLENITKKDGVNIDDVDVNRDSKLEVLLKQILDALDKLNRGGDNLTFNLYGDMDEERKMQRFLEAVRKDLAWNNKTAGRTIDG